MIRIYPLFFALTLLFFSSAYAQPRGIGLNSSLPEQRIALVIGNSSYEVAPLRNPVNDAQDMAQALRELGFDVIYKENLNQNDMRRAIRAFGEKIRGGGVGLFYYAGHGVQVKGINFLVPVDAKVESEEEVEYEAVDAGFVLAQMDSARNSMNIMILDACRNNPFARSFRSASRGLAQMDAPSGTLIAYATAPGSVASDGNARNGLYTQELLKNMLTPGLGIEDVFKRVRISVRNSSQGKQMPWESSSLVNDFYFVASSNKTEPAATKEANIPTVELAKSHAEKGRELIDNHEYTEAEAKYRIAVGLDPRESKYHYHLGRCLLFLDKWSEAETQLREAIQLEPSNPEYHYFLGYCLKRQEKREEAEASVKAAIKLNPNRAFYYYVLAGIFYSQKKFTEAEAAYKEAIRLAPSPSDRKLYEAEMKVVQVEERRRQLLERKKN